MASADPGLAPTVCVLTPEGYLVVQLGSEPGTLLPLVMVHVLFVYSKYVTCQGSSFPKLKKRLIDTASGDWGPT